MTNPNVEYKRAWVALRDKLGREPRASDPEYWELTNRLTRSYEAGRWEESARAGSSEEARSANLNAEMAPGAGSEPEVNSGASAAAQRAQEIARHESGPLPENWTPGPPQRLSPVLGSRGPNGGLYALCEGCGEMWEREKRRGRPVGKCLGCRE